MNTLKEGFNVVYIGKGKSNGIKGTVEKITPTVVYIRLENGIMKEYTKSSFERWWRTTSKPEKVYKTELLNDDGSFKGTVLAKAFLKIIEGFNDPDIFIEYGREGFKEGASIKIKCRNYAMFSVSVCQKKLVVYAHPDSLTPDNFRRAKKIYPKEWNRVLRAKYVFESLSQTPMMKAIIIDGIYFRKNM